MEANLVRKLTHVGLNYVGFVFLETTPIILAESAVILAREIRAPKETRQSFPLTIRALSFR